MVDDELTSTGEELPRGFAAIRAIEGIWLVDPDPGQFAPPAAQLVAQAGELLLLCERPLVRFDA